MKLRSISARNLKGLTFTLELSSLNVLIGSNFAGKTARTDAIRLLLLGYLPELGKLPRATFGLCSGRDLEVSGVFDNGDKMSRRWYLKDDSIKSEAVIPPSLEQVGDVVSVMLNAETYFGLSDRERVNYVFAHIPNLEAVSDREGIERDVFGELYNLEDVDSELLIEFKSGFNVFEKQFDPDGSPQEFLEAALAWASEGEKSLKAQSVVMTKTAQGLAYLRTQDAIREDELPAVERQIRDVNDAIANLRVDRGRASADVDAMHRNRRRRQVLTAELESRSRLAEQRIALARKLEELEQAARNPVPENREQVRDLEERVSMLEHSTARLEADVLPAAALDALRLEERDVIAKKAATEQELRGVVDARRRNQEELKELEAKDRCAYCGASGVAWKVLKSEEITSALSGLAAKRTQLETHLEKLREHATQLAHRITDANTAAGLYRGKSEELRSAREALAAAERNAANDAEVARRRRDEEIRSAREAVAAVDRSISATDAKAGELAAIPADVPTIEGDLERTVKAINAKLEELAGLEAKRRAMVGRAQDLRRLAEAEANRDKAKQREEIAKAAAAAFRRLQARFVSDAFEPLLRTANKFFGKILKTPLAYNAGEIGTWRDGVWVGHKTFSGAEKRLAYVAIQAALTSRAPFRLMLLDEIGTIHAKHVPALVNAIVAALQDGDLDQFVGIDLGRADAYRTEAELAGIELTLEEISESSPAISQ